MPPDRGFYGVTVFHLFHFYNGFTGFLLNIPNIVTVLLAGEPALRNDQPTETVTLTIPYGSPLKGSVVK